MSVFARDGKRRRVYWFRFELGGVEYQRSTKQGNREVAMNEEAKFRSKLVEGGIKLADPRKVATLEKFAPRFMTYTEQEKGAKPSTIRLYTRLLAHLRGSSALRDVPLSKIDSARFSEYVSERRETGRKGIGFTSIRGERRVLMALLHYAKEVGELAAVPKIRTPGKVNRRDYIPDKKTFLLYMRKASPLLRDVALLIASCGIRPQEAFSLTPSMIRSDRKGFGIALEDSKSDMGRKVIFVLRSNAPEACEVLTRRLAQCGGGLLFGAAPGRDAEERAERLSKVHGRLRKSLKLSPAFQLYSMRHLYGTQGARTLESHELREIMRHRDLKTTLIYYSPDEQDRRRIAAKVKLLKP